MLKHLSRISATQEIINYYSSVTRTRDLNDLIIVNREGKKWIRFGSYMYQPLSSVPKLIYGKSQTITIGPKGYAEWRSLPYQKKPIQITINPTSPWKLYDEGFKSIGGGTGNETAILPAGKGLGYLLLFENQEGLLLSILIKKRLQDV